MITRVQSTSTNTGATATFSFTLTWGSNLTVGNTVVIVYSLGNAVPLFCSTGGLIGTTIVNQQATQVYVFVYIGRVTTATNSIVFTTLAGATADIPVVAAEYSITNPIIDTFAVTTATSATVTTGSITTSYASELLIGACTQRTTNSTAAAETAWLGSITNSFSSVIQTSTFRNVSNVDRRAALLERIVTGAGTYSTGGTSISSNIFLGMTVGIREVQFQRVFGD